MLLASALAWLPGWRPALADPSFTFQTNQGSINCPAAQHGFNLLIIGSSHVSDEPGEFCRRYAEFLMVTQNLTDLRQFIATLPADSQIAYEEAIALWLAQRLHIQVPLQVKITNPQEFSNFWLGSDEALMRSINNGLREQDLRLQRIRQLELTHPEFRDAVRNRPIPNATDVQNRINQAQQEQQRRLDDARNLTNQLIPQLRFGATDGGAGGGAEGQKRQ